MLASLAFMAPVLTEYFQTGLVSRMPTWVLSMALMMISFMVFTAGLILDPVARSRAEQLRIFYLNVAGRKQRINDDSKAMRLPHA